MWGGFPANSSPGSAGGAGRGCGCAASLLSFRTPSSPTAIPACLTQTPLNDIRVWPQQGYWCPVLPCAPILCPHTLLRDTIYSFLGLPSPSSCPPHLPLVSCCSLPPRPYSSQCPPFGFFSPTLYAVSLSSLWSPLPPPFVPLPPMSLVPTLVPTQSAFTFLPSSRLATSWISLIPVLHWRRSWHVDPSCH